MRFDLTQRIAGVRPITGPAAELTVCICKAELWIRVPDISFREKSTFWRWLRQAKRTRGREKADMQKTTIFMGRNGGSSLAGFFCLIGCAFMTIKIPENFVRTEGEQK